MKIVLFKDSGSPPSVPLEAKFSERGGTIGRGLDCTLILPDPFRHVSRVQAEITFDGGLWVLTDKGSVNSFARGGLEFGRNKQTVLNDQDILTLGEYELRVDFSDAAQVVMPATYSTEAVPVSTFWSGISASPSASSHPFQDLFPQTGADDSTKKTIPDDFDIFAPVRSTLDSEVQSTDKLGQVFSSRPNQANSAQFERAANSNISDDDSLDNLFGLHSAQQNSQNLQGESVDDPLAGYLSQNKSLDAFGLLEAKTAPVADVQQRQDSPELNTPFVLPNPIFAAPVNNAVDLEVIANAAIDQHQSRIAPRIEEPFTATLAGINRQTSEAIRNAAIAQEPAKKLTDISAKSSEQSAATVSPKAPAASMPVKPVAAAVAKSVEKSVMSDEQFEFLKQLLLGIGLSELPKAQTTGVQAPSAITPELMFRLGQLIKISTNGVLEMLEARNLLKREMKAEVTMILKGGNNPLKFSPDALGAAAHLLSPTGVRGFMQPVEALQDAFDDLLAHQVGFVAGMRAATEALIQRFDPKLLEARLEKKSLVETMMPSKRKSKLWERYEELFGEIKVEAEDDFEALFGREFVTAYEAQVEQIKQQRQERG